MSNVKETIEAVQGIVEAVPVYEDMLQPASKELGKSLHTITKVVNIALSPLTGLVWGYEKIAKYLETSMAEKLKDVPEENITTPNPSIAVPAIEALRYTGEIEELREMFSNLIATAMNKETSKVAHPSYVEVIKQLNSDEAIMLREIYKNLSVPIVTVRVYGKERKGFDMPLVNFSILPYRIGCKYPELGPSYIENLSRLGLLEISYTTYCTAENSYEPIIEHKEIQNWQKYVDLSGKHHLEIMRGSIAKTNFGTNFMKACT